MYNKLNLRRDSIENQIELLEILRMRHLNWVSEIQNTEMAQLHTEVIDLLEQALRKYSALLDLYRDPGR